ncbi:NUDIX hydrolase [Alkalilimnicola sp. S0819]|uniref:NUDIX hydrolase n=1 Tax=Alkalilimnicola sp. S0819 TaxID=2613922 RepID=UPI001261FB86|nr:NUDIX domain-containing protein [Alkalilimnicola sp. S0819]KAB7619534.1 NUDIX hydrolase [Alkalilimnicola sp. S0819]MPQ17641.1 NUDIX domain-containing protein [Alkalilimnicola sp. S0819]
MADVAALQAGVSTDVVIFTIREGALSVLLVRRAREPYQGAWSLPGGRLAEGECLDGCAQRMLREQTGIRDIYLEQLYTFGQPGRDPRGRIVSVAYFALFPYGEAGCALAADERRCWRRVDGLAGLAFDHGEMVALARRRLASKLEYSTIALQLMPERFTLSELQGVYESILGETLDKRNFRKRLRALDCLEDTGALFRAGKHRPAKLYRASRPDRVQIIK